MDRNTVIGFLLIGAIFITFTILNKPSEEELQRDKYIRDSIAQVQRDQQLEEIKESQESPTNQVVISKQSESSEMIDTTQLINRYGSFAQAAVGNNELITLENNLIKLKVSTKGGRPYSVELKEYKTYDSLPLILFNGDSTEFGFNIVHNRRNIYTNNFFFSPLSNQKVYVAENSPQTLKLRLSYNEECYIEYEYTLKPKSYLVDYKINISDNQNVFVPVANRDYYDLIWKIYSPKLEKGADYENNYTTIGFKHKDEEVGELRSFRSKDNQDKEIGTKLEWIAFKQQFFSSILVAEEYFEHADIEYNIIENPEKHLKIMNANMGIAYYATEDRSIPFSFYFGPNSFHTLKSYNKDFEKLIPLGKNIIKFVNRIIIIPVFRFLEGRIESYGIIILLLTIFIKILVFPMTYKSYISGAKMRVLKPQVDEIGKKFPKQEDAMKKQQATMALYKKVGVSPLGGCLPMVIQFPILIAMFRFFPASFELRQEKFLWADDLSTYDSILQLPFEVPFNYGDHVSLFTFLMFISSIIYTRVNSQMTSASSQQMPGMKFMMYFMPVMLLFWFNNYAAALSYYYFLANMITFGQMAIIKRFINEEEILAKLTAKANTKTVKKSKFQQRLEKMAKERGISMPRK